MPDLDEVIAEILSEEKDGPTGSRRKAIEWIVRAMVAKAARGDVRAAQLIMDRAYGKVKVNVEIEARPIPSLHAMLQESEDIETLRAIGVEE